MRFFDLLLVGFILLASCGRQTRVELIESGGAAQLLCENEYQVLPGGEPPSFFTLGHRGEIPSLGAACYQFSANSPRGYGEGIYLGKDGQPRHWMGILDCPNSVDWTKLRDPQWLDAHLQVAEFGFLSENETLSVEYEWEKVRYSFQCTVASGNQ
jgi:hypothetical protein